MKKIVFVCILALALVACAGYSLKVSDNKIGIGGTDKAGNSYFCTYDQKVESGKYDFTGTCSMTVKTKNGIFDCEKISLEKIGKDFEIETDCKVLIDFSEKEAYLFESQKIAVLEKTDGLSRSRISP